MGENSPFQHGSNKVEKTVYILAAVDCLADSGPSERNDRGLYFDLEQRLLQRVRLNLLFALSKDHCHHSERSEFEIAV